MLFLRGWSALNSALSRQAHPKEDLRLSYFFGGEESLLYLGCRQLGVGWGEAGGVEGWIPIQSLAACPPLPTKDLFSFEMDIMTSSTGCIWTKPVHLP